MKQVRKDNLSLYFVFDLDETLIHSKEVILAYQRRIFALLGRPFPEEEAELFYTLGPDQVRSRFFTPEEIAWISAHGEEIAQSMGFKGIRKKASADALLKELRRRRIPFGLLTNRGTSLIPLLEHLRWKDLFFPILSYPDNPYPKPDPRALVEFSLRADTPLSSLVFVGDSSVDEQCARDAGVVFLGVGRKAPGWFPTLTHLLRFLKEHSFRIPEPMFCEGLRSPLKSTPSPLLSPH